MTTALSARSAEALSRYVAAGGIALGVGSAGLMDEHCRRLDQGQLDTLFGSSAPRGQGRVRAVKAPVPCSASRSLSTSRR